MWVRCASDVLVLGRRCSPFFCSEHPQQPVVCYAHVRWLPPNKEHLERNMFLEFADLGILIELVSCGVIMMGNDWRKLRPVEVHMEEAMEVACFWSDFEDRGVYQWVHEKGSYQRLA